MTVLCRVNLAAVECFIGGKGSGSGRFHLKRESVQCPAPDRAAGGHQFIRAHAIQVGDCGKLCRPPIRIGVWLFRLQRPANDHRAGRRQDGKEADRRQPGNPPAAAALRLFLVLFLLHPLPHTFRCKRFRLNRIQRMPDPGPNLCILHLSHVLSCPAGLFCQVRFQKCPAPRQIRSDGGFVFVHQFGRFRRRVPLIIVEIQRCLIPFRQRQQDS